MAFLARAGCKVALTRVPLPGWLSSEKELPYCAQQGIRHALYPGEVLKQALHVQGVGAAQQRSHLLQNEDESALPHPR